MSENLDKMYEAAQAAVSNHVADINKKLEDLMVAELMANAVPVIKGEITKGKLKVRGIAIGNFNGWRWIIQRGKPISKAYKIQMGADPSNDISIKPVEVTSYIMTEEVENLFNKPQLIEFTIGFSHNFKHKKEQGLSRLRGRVTRQSADEIDKQVNDLRSEWERDKPQP